MGAPGSQPSSASHDRAAKTARQRMLSYIAYFGQPAGMFTVTPEDNFNFRIRIMMGMEESKVTIPVDSDFPHD